MQNNSEINVETIRQSYNRLSLMSQNQVLLRALINTDKEYEPNQSKLSQNRYDEYKVIQKDAIDRLQTAHQYLKSSKFKKTSFFFEYVKGENTGLEYFGKTTLDSDLIEQKITLNVAMNIFISKAIEINSYSKEQIAGDTYIQRVGGVRGGQVPDDYERNIFVVIQNGLRRLRRMLSDVSLLYIKDAQYYSFLDLTTAIITMLVSIAAIIGIGLIITPMLTLSETRRYSSLTFFFKVPASKIKELIDTSDLFNNEFEQSLQNSHAHQQALEKSKHKKKNESGSIYDNTLMEVQSYTHQSSTPIIKKKSIINKQDAVGPDQQDDEEEKFDGSGISSHMISSSGGQLQDKNRGKIFMNKKQLQKLKSTMQSNRDFNPRIQEAEEEKESDSSDSQDKDHEAQPGIDGDSHVVSDLEREQSNIDFLNRYTKKRRLNMILYMLALLTSLASYFVIQYFLSIRIFNNAGSVVADLQVIFFKRTCFDMVMGYAREDLVRNYTFQGNDPSVPTAAAGYTGPRLPMGSAFQLHFDYCQIQEEKYRAIRRNLPLYFDKIKDYIDQLESDQMCDLIFIGDLATLNHGCKIALNGLASQGLSNAMSFMYQQILKQKIQYNKLGDTYLRSETVLREMISDPIMIEMLDFKLIILDRAFRNLNNIAKESVGNYIYNLLEQFQAVYIVFVVILSLFLVAFLIFGFQKLKVIMLETNMILRIIPYETLQPHDREKVKEFFNQ